MKLEAKWTVAAFFLAALPMLFIHYDAFGEAYRFRNAKEAEDAFLENRKNYFTIWYKQILLWELENNKDFNFASLNNEDPPDEFHKWWNAIEKWKLVVTKDSFLKERVPLPNDTFESKRQFLLNAKVWAFIKQRGLENKPLGGPTASLYGTHDVGVLKVVDQIDGVVSEHPAFYTATIGASGYLQIFNRSNNRDTLIFNFNQLRTLKESPKLGDLLYLMELAEIAQSDMYAIKYDATVGDLIKRLGIEVSKEIDAEELNEMALLYVTLMIAAPEAAVNIARYGLTRTVTRMAIEEAVQQTTGVPVIPTDPKSVKNAAKRFTQAFSSVRGNPRKTTLYDKIFKQTQLPNNLKVQTVNDREAVSILDNHFPAYRTRLRAYLRKNAGRHPGALTDDEMIGNGLRDQNLIVSQNNIKKAVYGTADDTRIVLLPNSRPRFAVFEEGAHNTHFAFLKSQGRKRLDYPEKLTDSLKESSRQAWIEELVANKALLKAKDKLGFSKDEIKTIQQNITRYYEEYLNVSGSKVSQSLDNIIDKDAADVANLFK